MPKKDISIDYSLFSGGLNTVDDPLHLDKDQVQAGTINAILTQKGATRRPGMIGLKSTPVFPDYLKGLHVYLQEDGTEKLLGLSGGKVYDVNETTGVTTQRFDTGNTTGEGCFRTQKNNAWVCNGAAIAKIEGTVGYQVGITPPASGTATPKSGGSLALGVYDIYISYYRKVSGVIVLYSKGYHIGAVTLSGSNQTITITAPANADPQCSGLVVWMTDAGGSVNYSYATQDGAGAFSFDVASASSKSVSLLYAVEAVDNGRPPNFTYIEFQNNMLWGIDPSVPHRVWYSNKSGTVYDFERFPAQNFIDYPFQVTGLIAIGSDLFINTKAGMIVQPGADPSQKFEWVDHRYYFAFMGTVAYWGGSVIGLTNDGVRSFDGSSFSPDLTDKVKNIISPIYNIVENHLPCGWIAKRYFRTEYHLSFNDNSIGTAGNNRSMVLNLDTITAITSTESTTSWELWGIGNEYCAVSGLNVQFRGQSSKEPVSLSGVGHYDDGGAGGPDAYTLKWVSGDNYAAIQPGQDVIINGSTFSVSGKISDTQISVICFDLSTGDYSFSAIGTLCATVYRESLTTSQDQYLYSESGAYLSLGTDNTVKIVTRNNMPSLRARCKFERIRILAKINESVDVLVTIGDRYAASGDNTVGPVVQPARFGIARFSLGKFNTEFMDTFKKPLPMSLNGYSCFVTITQAKDDINFQILGINLEGTAVTGRFV